MEYQEDTLWIQRIKQGDATAFKSMVDKYQRMVFTIAFRILEKREEAEDAAQEVFVKCYRNLQKFDGRSAFSTWLYKIALNHSLDILRKNKKEFFRIEFQDGREGEPIISENVFEKNIDLKSVIKILNEAINNLPPAERILIILYYYEELSLGEIAGIFGIKENNMKVKLHRIRLKMMKLLQSKNEIVSILNL